MGMGCRRRWGCLGRKIPWGKNGGKGPDKIRDLCSGCSGEDALAMRQ